MDVFRDKGKDDELCDGSRFVRPGTADVYVQLTISAVLGLSAFVAFCILRPRWSSLFASRRRHSDPKVALPELPDTFFGWMPALYRVTEEQVLASAGLDAFVFLSFFKMSIRLFSVMLFFAAVVLWPINHQYSDTPRTKSLGEQTARLSDYLRKRSPGSGHENDPDRDVSFDITYLWAYLVFTWFFTLLTIYYLNTETFKMVRIRQDYLGTQSTITDRTFRLTGIPADLRSEEKLKEFVENLEIGDVESVTICRDWTEIDALMAERDAILRKVEEVWSVYLAQQAKATPAVRNRARGTAARSSEQPGNGQIVEENDFEAEARDDDEEHEHTENGRLLPANESLRGLVSEPPRPIARIRHGFLKLRSRPTDAIDYYEEKLRRADEKIAGARKKEYTPTATAFITMDSIAASQMAIQALIDPRPGQLLTKPAPSPNDVVWKNTYAPLYRRSIQSWMVTIFVTFLTLIWIVPVGLVAALLSYCTIRSIYPALAEALMRHAITQALVQTALPVGVVTLLNVAVPYLYDYLSNQQGVISQGDVELSIVSKNFFFVFFNVFFVFAVSSTTSNIIPVLEDSLKDTRELARALAGSIRRLGDFYLCFIMLQGLGLFPVRLLQAGSVFWYPIYRMGAKTPRDFKEMVQPALFNYGFYLPTALLIFMLCLVYSILPRAQLVLFLGLIYFSLGYFTYKYQLLYSMDQPQHATGGAWVIIAYRIVLGLVVFQVVMSGILLLERAFTAAGLILPLLVITVWYSYYFTRQFTPLTRFISLRSIKRGSDPGGRSHPDQDPAQASEEMRLTRRMSTVDEDREKGMRFVNPSLVKPLEQPWIYQDPPPVLPAEESAVASTDGGAPTNGASAPGLGSGSSSLSLGDAHIWRDGAGDNNV